MVTDERVAMVTNERSAERDVMDTDERLSKRGVMVTGWGPVLQWPPPLSEAPGIRVQAATLILTSMGLNQYGDK